MKSSEELALLAQSGDGEAYEMLYRRYIPLCYKIAMKFGTWSNNVELRECLSETHYSFCESVMNYRTGKGANFTSFLYRNLQQSRRYKTKRIFEQSVISPSNIQKGTNLIPTCSYDISMGENVSLIEMFQGENNVDIFLAKEFIYETIETYFSTLNEGRRYSLEAKRFNTDNRLKVLYWYLQGFTNKEIGQKLGVNESRIHQLKMEVFNGLRKVYENAARP